MQIEEGLLLLKKNCYACHNPNTTSHGEIIAPPIQGIKEHYLRAYPSREAFSSAMVSFVGNPIEEKALMKGPVKRFGLMPKPPIPEEELQKIIAYFQDNKLETPAWWADHTNGGH
ncbi:MAG: c-type cytochrome [Algoriphagus sp.]|nr:c-type cytochrome [Algoriphagus sp.]